MTEAGASDSPPASPPPEEESRIVPFVFEGKTGEFFRIWIVNIVLTLLTLGIYSAWAKVRTNRYFYGSTRLEGRSFDYTARPVAILKGRIVAAAVFAIWYFTSTFYPLLSLFLIPPILLAIPWVIVRSLKFRTFNTRYRGLRFHFTGTYMDAAKAYIFLPLLTPFSLGLLWPYVAFRRGVFHMHNLGFGNRRSSFFGKPGGYYSIWLGLVLYLIAAIVVIGFAVFVVMADSGEFPPTQMDRLSLQQMLDVGLIYALIIFAIYVFPPAYLKVKQGNYVLNHSQVAGFLPHSSMRVPELFWIYATNILAIVLTLGLAIPWAMIRATRYRLDHTALEVRGNLDDIEAGARDRIGAAGEELGEVFSLDIGF